MKTFADLKTEFNELYLPSIPADDEPMLNEEWNNYTDSECKGGNITDLQYHYCPSYEDCPDTEGDDDTRLLVLKTMGVRLGVWKVSSRPDGLMDDLPRHFGFNLSRNDRNYDNYFSQGSAITDDPDLTDILGAMLSDTGGAIDDFDDWCGDYGCDTDSRKAYATWEACVTEAKALCELFTSSELADLRTMFEDR